MSEQPLLDVVRSIDARLERVEQVLPGLATKTELRHTANQLATKVEFHEAVSQLATKVELREAVSQLATKAELREAVSQLATKMELREEGERTRRHFDMVAERLEDRIQLMAEALSVHREHTDREIEDLRKADAELDKRVVRLEARRRR